MDTSDLELIILEIQFVGIDGYTCQNTGYNENSQSHLDTRANFFNAIWCQGLIHRLSVLGSFEIGFFDTKINILVLEGLLNGLWLLQRST